MRKVSGCYMCDAPETSREHAPPLCFFPEAGPYSRDLRRNLITVPSCDQHNSKKSKDDEFFRTVILMQAASASEAARHQFFAKLIPAVSRIPASHGSFFADWGTLAAGSKRALQIDRTRFDSCVAHLLRALFFHETARKWALPVAVTSPIFYSAIASDQAVPHLPTLNAVQMSREVLGSSPIRGENPEIFRYRMRYEEADRSLTFAAIFYDFFEVFSYSSPGLGLA